MWETGKEGKEKSDRISNNFKWLLVKNCNSFTEYIRYKADTLGSIKYV